MAPNYENGKVYVVRNTTNSKLYVGSTVRTLAQRMAEHRIQAKNGLIFPFYSAMREIGIEKFYIELLADYKCDRKEQLNKEEGRHMRELNALVPNGYNQILAGRSMIEWNAENAEAIKAKRKEFNIVHKEKRDAFSRAYHKDNIEAIHERHKQYQIDNAEAIKTRNKQRRDANAEKVKECNRAYDAAHRDERAKAARERYHAISDENRDAINARQRAKNALRKAAAAIIAPSPE